MKLLSTIKLVLVAISAVTLYVLTTSILFPQVDAAPPMNGWFALLFMLALVLQVVGWWGKHVWPSIGTYRGLGESIGWLGSIPAIMVSGSTVVFLIVTLASGT